jgi:4-diphosphocytidyl-2-C-methyl-D-erythritol kinase
METEFAPAKINLTLHVTGRRGDGYHLLDSLVAFADVGDRVSVTADAGLSLTVTGPYGQVLSAGEDNLALRAARLFGAGAGARIILEKNLPVASGIGGGSADAAAALRVLSRLWGLALPDHQALAGLGADVPVCLSRSGMRMTGAGEVLTPVDLPKAWLVLVNPGVAVATPDVFGALAEKDNTPMPVTLPPFADAAGLAGFLRAMRNDLQTPAVSVAPAIAGVLAALESGKDCLIARTSGSGATCFGLFAGAEAAGRTADALKAAHPGWWVRAARMIS